MKYKNLSLILLLAGMLFSADAVLANYNVGIPVRPLEKPKKKRLLASCVSATAQVDLDINNVRARIMNGGDMWWDLVSTAKYEVPKTEFPRRTALFAGALWIGGFDRSNLKEAAMTYRQSGSDFYPGPIDTTSATVSGDRCAYYDKIWKVNKEDIDKYKLGNSPTDAILTWPGNGDNITYHESYFLAPYVDVDHDGRYNPDPNGGLKSDYPDIKGDQALWFVYNDVGNIHNETQASPIGLELRTMAFAFVTNDQVNNMTFYENTIINRAKSKLDSTYFGEWVDADLGYAYDDYVGCDTTRDLGICYNGDNFDGPGTGGYGDNPPCVGVDFFEGPKGDKGQTLGMAKFVYYNNDFQVQGNPDKPEHYYYYLTGRWKDGKYITKWFDGRKGTVRTNYMFSGNPLKNSSNDWTESNTGPGSNKNTPADRRFLQSAGPFTLKPGAVNKVTVGVVWARASTGGPLGAYSELLYADDIAQKLFENKFKPIIGPEPPVVKVTELDQKVILSFINQNHSIDTTEQFDRTYPSGQSGKSLRYRFEGYQIFQVKTASVSTGELDDINKARLVAQVDLKNGTTKLVNSKFDRDLGTVKVLKVNGENKGIRHTFEITTDQFADGDNKLVNNKFYYYIVQAYASDTTTGATEPYLSGKASRINGLEQIKAVPHKSIFGNTDVTYGTGVRITKIEGSGNGGEELEFTDETYSSFFSPILKSYVENPVYKNGNGPVNVKVMDPKSVKDGKYQIQIIDTTVTTPASPDGKVLTAKSMKWVLSDVTDPTNIKKWRSDKTMNLQNEQVIPELGFVLNIFQPTGSFDTLSPSTNGLIKSSFSYNDNTKPWMGGISDQEAFSGSGLDDLPNPTNWIHAGTYKNKYNTSTSITINPGYMIDDFLNGTNHLDGEQVYEKIMGRTIAPAALCAKSISQSNYRSHGNMLTMGPMPYYTNLNPSLSQFQNIASINLVYTSDRSKWTKCMVLEMCEEASLSEGGVPKFALRKHGNPYKVENGMPAYDPNNAAGREEGYSWFPGYAVNMETGERLNIIFGEDSHLGSENGNDMLWNPTNNYANWGYVNPASFADYQAYESRYLWGGKHWVYVMGTTSYVGDGVKMSPTKRLASGHRYDSCAFYQYLINGGTDPYDKKITGVLSSAMYIHEAALGEGYKLLSPENGLIPNDLTIKIRVEKPYSAFRTSAPATNNYMPVYNFSTGDIAPTTSVEAGKKGMDKITIVPNPYYAYSEYENSQLDNRVRISNLPKKCKITIYTMDGSLVRKMAVDYPAGEDITYLDWDMKNNSGVPVASGAYIIHIDGYDYGTKIIKWFGVMRPIDLDTF